jgi:hypothetical protein
LLHLSEDETDAAILDCVKCARLWLIELRGLIKELRGVVRELRWLLGGLAGLALTLHAVLAIIQQRW